MCVTAWRGLALSSASDRRRGAGQILDYLTTFPGGTWQERWVAAGRDEPGYPITDLAGDDPLRARTLQRGLRALWCLRVIQPSLGAYYAVRLTRYSEQFQALQKDPLLDRFFTHIDASDESHQAKRVAKADTAAALTVFGISLVDLTPEALLHYSMESRYTPRSGGGHPRGFQFGARQAWQFLHSMGHFSASTPSTVREAMVRGQLTVAELVDRHNLRNEPVRDLLVDYVTRRSVGLDYSSTAALARTLAGLFWATIERINPAQLDLRLSEETYQQWRAEVSVRADGKPRLNRHVDLMAVRSFYLDLQSWAVGEPERWGLWAAPCPIRSTEFKAAAKDSRRAKERTAERTRQRQPLLELLMSHVEERHGHLDELLAAAAATSPGAEFDHGGRRYRRTNSRIDQLRARKEGTMPVRVLDLADDKAFDVGLREELAFWEWAVIATLRHSGIRIEELCELTHLSLRQYQRPSGEVVALLVIAPSKTDRERVIPVSAELFSILAAVVRRHLRNATAISAISRYDIHEKVWSDPLPFLFQRKHGVRRAVTSFKTINRMIRRRCEELATIHPAFAEARFAPHDFRRLFATELVNNGLPIHIGAALLGHLDTRTTGGYVAVFNEDLVRHYQAYLERRRTQRPADEYRRASDAEWTEFEDHFDKRKVELGTCGRPYGMPCQHEHACIRCPVLHIDPKMLARLDDLETDLVARKERAQTEGWLGEIEGIDLTLSFLRNKRTRAQRLTAPTHLGLPGMRQR